MSMDIQTHFQEIGEAFCAQFYNSFSQQGLQSVVPFYHPSALMTFHEFKGMGHTGITEVLGSKCQFKKIHHSTTNVDCHPMPDGILVMATGWVKTDDDQHSLPFSQSFVLKPFGNSFVIFNDIFRIILGDQPQA